MREIWIECRRATAASIQEVIGVLSAGEATDGSPVQPQSAANGTDTQTLSEQFVNVSVALLGSGSQPTW
jgi:hypothetical protein